MFRAIERFFIGVFSFLFVQMFGLISAMPVDEGGLGFPGFAGFLIWIVLMYIFFKVSKPGAAVFGFIGYLILRLRIVGTDGVSTFLADGGGNYVLGLIALIVFFKVLSGSSSSSSVTGNVGSGRASGHKCPRCGSTLISVPARKVPTGRYEIQDGKGYWHYDYSSSQTKSTWVVPKVQVPEYEVVPPHYECPDCGYSSR